MSVQITKESVMVDGVNGAGGAEPLDRAAFQKRVANKIEGLKMNSVFTSIQEVNPDATSSLETTAFLQAVFDKNDSENIDRKEVDDVSCEELEARINGYESESPLNIPSCGKLKSELNYRIDLDKNISKEQQSQLGFVAPLDTAQTFAQNDE